MLFTPDCRFRLICAEPFPLIFLTESGQLPSVRPRLRTWVNSIYLCSFHQPSSMDCMVRNYVHQYCIHDRRLMTLDVGYYDHVIRSTWNSQECRSWQKDRNYPNRTDEPIQSLRNSMGLEILVWISGCLPERLFWWPILTEECHRAVWWKLVKLVKPVTLLGVPCNQVSDGNGR